MITKPFLKWVGGKTQIINTILEQIPTVINDYHELFLGGGSVLLGVLSLLKDEKIIIKGDIFAYDINYNLISLYKNIQTNHNKLYEMVIEYRDEYDKYIGKDINRKPIEKPDKNTSSKESYYYWLRKEFNNSEKGSINNSALFLFINKLCFRGMYREGKNGYNVPYGHYKKTPSIITKDDITYISELIKNVKFIHSDFIDSFKNIKSDEQNDFVYLDPPYAPENDKSFVGYDKNGFKAEKHQQLFSLTKQLKCKLMMSNSNVDIVRNNFNEYNIKEIICRRAINSKHPESKTTEVIITNY